jgi:predicted lipoprotein with Yx(FWY)xxD motif
MTTMTKLLTPAVAAVLLLSACGGGNDNSGDDNSGGGSGNAAAAGAKTVSVKSIEGAGDVLVDRSGAALYTSDQEADGKVRCIDGCASDWLPLAAPAGNEKPTAASDVPGKLGVVRRPDGSRQVTHDGTPLYSFADDNGPGRVTGDGFSDEFRGEKFTWNVSSTGDGGGSGGSSSPSSGY